MPIDRNHALYNAASGSILLVGFGLINTESIDTVEQNQKIQGRKGEGM